MYKKLLGRTRSVVIAGMVLFLVLGTIFLCIMINAAPFSDWFDGQYIVLTIFMLICYIIGLFFLVYLISGKDTRKVKKVIAERGWAEDSIDADISEGIHISAANIGKRYMIFVYDFEYHLILLEDIEGIYYQRMEQTTHGSWKKQMVHSLANLTTPGAGQQQQYLVFIEMKKDAVYQFLSVGIEEIQHAVKHIQKIFPDVQAGPR